MFSELNSNYIEKSLYQNRHSIIIVINNFLTELSASSLISLSMHTSHFILFGYSQDAYIYLSECGTHNFDEYN